MDGLLNKFKVLHIKIKNHSIILSNRQISVMEFVCFEKYREANRDGKAVKRGI